VVPMVIGLLAVLALVLPPPLAGADDLSSSFLPAPQAASATAATTKPAQASNGTGREPASGVRIDTP
jgi:hypothetical protein